MKNNLKNRLWLTNTITMISAIAIIVFFINMSAIYEFKIYKVKNQEGMYNDILKTVSKQYIHNNWELWLLQEVGEDILINKDALITLYNQNGKILYDTGYSKKFNEQSFEVMNDGNVVGTLVIGSKIDHTENDENFINRLNEIVILIGLAAIAVTSLVSNIASEKISRPISNIINTASKISEGQYASKVQERTSILELKNLALAINHLSDNLSQHEVLRKRLTQDIAHELRTPITTIKGSFEAALDGVWEMNTENIASCYEEIERLSRLVDDLNDLAKYENTVLNKSEFNLHDLLQGIVHQYEFSFKEKNLQVELQCGDIALYADKDKMTQVFVNILSNAVQYSGAFGIIKIAAVLENSDRCKISIFDTGIGISKEDLPFIFERFYRADKSRNRKNGGAGIGLSIAKAVVEAHNGTIVVLSEPSVLTEFIISVPIR